MPSDRAIAQAWREVSADPMLCNAGGLIKRVTERAAELDAQQKPADGGQRESHGSVTAQHPMPHPVVRPDSFGKAGNTAANVPSGLPELPEPDVMVPHAGEGWVYAHSDDQMRAYGEQCRLAVGLVAVNEATQDSIDTILNRLQGWGKAYPLDMFREPTDEEREWLHRERRGLMDRIAASMGRHMAKCIAEDVTALTAALGGREESNG